MSHLGNVLTRYVRGRTSGIDQILQQATAQAERSERAIETLTTVRACYDDAERKIVEAEKLLAQVQELTGDALDSMSLGQEEGLELQHTVMMLARHQAGIIQMSTEQMHQMAHLELVAQNYAVYFRGDVETVRAMLEMVDEAVLQEAFETANDESFHKARACLAAAESTRDTTEAT